VGPARLQPPPELGQPLRAPGGQGGFAHQPVGLEEQRGSQLETQVPQINRPIDPNASTYFSL
jgi:hypothetical protein